MVVVLDEVLKLSFILSSEVTQAPDVLLLAVSLVSTEPITPDKHHAEPSETRRPTKFQNVTRGGDASCAGVLHQAFCFEKGDLGGRNIGWISCGWRMVTGSVAGGGAADVSAVSACATVAVSYTHLTLPTICSV